MICHGDRRTVIFILVSVGDTVQGCQQPDSFPSFRDLTQAKLKPEATEKNFRMSQCKVEWKSIKKGFLIGLSSGVHRKKVTWWENKTYPWAWLSQRTVTLNFPCHSLVMFLLGSEKDLKWDPRVVLNMHWSVLQLIRYNQRSQELVGEVGMFSLQTNVPSLVCGISGKHLGKEWGHSQGHMCSGFQPGFLVV